MWIIEVKILDVFVPAGPLILKVSASNGLRRKLKGCWLTVLKWPPDSI
jgi:hypothetical protein